MSNHQHPQPFDEVEYLDLKQAAVICSVSDERFGKWIDKGMVPVIEHQGRKLIHSHDLIQHLVRHNIPIPDRLLQGNSKKILFVLASDAIPHSATAEVVWSLYKLRKHTAYIFDFVRLDPQMELKIITLGPDMIVLVQEDPEDRRQEQQVRKLTNGAIPIHIFAAGRIVELERFLGE